MQKWCFCGPGVTCEVVPVDRRIQHIIAARFRGQFNSQSWGANYIKCWEEIGQSFPLPMCVSSFRYVVSFRNYSISKANIRPNFGSLPLLTRNSSGDEIANVNFLYDDYKIS